MSEPTDVQRLVAQIMADASPEEQAALLDGLLSGKVSSLVSPWPVPETPTLLPTPTEVQGFRVRLDLQGARPPVWRRLELPGDLTLPRLHEVIQAAMGWSDSHLHRFRTGSEYRSPSFVTQIDVDEGDEGVLEDGVRFDELVAAVGDRLWYEYDFGDGWEHVLKVEALLDEPPETARCTGGRMACPPEDCGGLGGYEQLAEWVRSGYDDELLPEGFENAEHGHSWLGDEWHPDRFDVDEANEALAFGAAEPVAVTGEIAELAEALERRGVRLLREVLARPLSHGPTSVSVDEAVRLTEPYRLLLETIGDGVRLTAAGYLPPALVEQLAESSGVTRWWFGKANREDLTGPVAMVRETARALGFVAVRKGRLSPTKAGVRCRDDAQALWQHIVGRLPLGTQESERHAGWMALAVVGSGVPESHWRGEISDLLYALGWRSGDDHFSSPPAYSQTLDVLSQLDGAARKGWDLSETDPAVATTARAVLARGVRSAY